MVKKKGLIGFPETSVRKNHYSLRNNPEERNSHLLRGRSLKSSIRLKVFLLNFARNLLHTHENEKCVEHNLYRQIKGTLYVGRFQPFIGHKGA
jgi:hypothetical protein